MHLLSACNKLNRLVCRDKNIKNVISRQFVNASASKVPEKSIEKRSAARKFEYGETYHGFNCKNVKYYPEFKMTAYVLKHERLDSEYLHVSRNDNNNVFSVNFRTPVRNSTGLPHILEHLSLCGSKNFPVRDPFFKMLNRSMATFMNAMTGPDYTLYPFSTTNEKDYRNLQKIYLDAVFNPNLRYMDFLQEGWRLENTDLNDINSEMTFKGVVFNEMKGAFATNNTILEYATLNNLLPDTYGSISGGWPLDIPQLTWNDLVVYHRKFYHPHNAKFFSYGNFDPMKSLQYINETILSKFEPQLVPSRVNLNSTKLIPEEFTVTCRFNSIGAPMEKQCHIAFGYKMCLINEAYDVLILHVLSELLIKGPNSAFYKTLIEPNKFGGSFGANTGYDAQLRDTTFVVSLQNVSSKDFKLIKDTFDSTIDDVVDRGFDGDHVQSILNSIELNIKHQTPQFGLNLLFGVTAAWNHDAKILNSMNIGKLLEQLKIDIASSPTFLQTKVAKYFQKNKHNITVHMLPDPEYDEKLTKQENELLAERVRQLSKSDKEQLFRITNELAKEQKEPPQNIDLLPCLTMNDIPKNVEELNIQHVKVNKIPTQLTLVDTNDIVYARGICYANQLTQDEVLLLPLLTQIFPKMGTNSYDYREFDKMLHLKTSGLSFNLYFAENIADVNQYQLGVEFGTYCLQQNTANMFDLIKELLLNFKLVDVQRFTVLLEEYVSALTADIAHAGHMYAVQGASSLIHQTYQLKAHLNGIKHIEYMRNLQQDRDPADILAQLQQVAQKLFTQSAMKYALNMSERSKVDVMKSFNSFTEEIDSCVDPNKLRAEMFIDTKQLLQGADAADGLHHVVNLPVNYCSKSILMVPYKNKFYAPLQILSKILTSKYLLPVVREQNGAYGAGAKLDMNGSFNFYSYRDPRNKETLDVFDNTLTWLRDNWSTIDDQAIFEAKLAVLQGIDAPISAGSKGMREFRHGITSDLFNQFRIRVIDTKKDKLQKAFERYFITNESEYKCQGKCVLGPSNDGLKKDEEKWITNQFKASNFSESE